MKRARTAIYAICMTAAILLVVLLAAKYLLPQQPARFTSKYEVSTVPPMQGFPRDSLVNSGDAAALDVLPGVGAVISQRIVETRELLGGYRIPEDLLLVKGIGEKTLAKIMGALEEQLVRLPETTEGQMVFSE